MSNLSKFPPLRLEMYATKSHNHWLSSIWSPILCIGLDMVGVSQRQVSFTVYWPEDYRLHIHYLLPPIWDFLMVKTAASRLDLHKHQWNSESRAIWTEWSWDSFHKLQENNSLRRFFHTKEAPFVFQHHSHSSDYYAMFITHDQRYDFCAVGYPERPNEQVKRLKDAGSIQVQPSCSIFKKSGNLSIILLVAFAPAFSSLSSLTYFPALTAVANDLHTVSSKSIWR